MLDPFTDSHFSLPYHLIIAADHSSCHRLHIGSQPIAWSHISAPSKNSNKHTRTQTQREPHTCAVTQADNSRMKWKRQFPEKVIECECWPCCRNFKRLHCPFHPLLVSLSVKSSGAWIFGVDDKKRSMMTPDS